MGLTCLILMNVSTECQSFCHIPWSVSLQEFANLIYSFTNHLLSIVNQPGSLIVVQNYRNFLWLAFLHLMAASLLLSETTLKEGFCLRRERNLHGNGDSTGTV